MDGWTGCMYGWKNQKNIAMNDKTGLIDEWNMAMGKLNITAGGWKTTCILDVYTVTADG